jgi:hypothetical protein
MPPLQVGARNREPGVSGHQHDDARLSVGERANLIAHAAFWGIVHRLLPDRTAAQTALRRLALGKQRPPGHLAGRTLRFKPGKTKLYGVRA